MIVLALTSLQNWGNATLETEGEAIHIGEFGPWLYAWLLSTLVIGTAHIVLFVSGQWEKLGALVVVIELFGLTFQTRTYMWIRTYRQAVSPGGLKLSGVCSTLLIALGLQFLLLIIPPLLLGALLLWMSQHPWTGG